MLDIQNPIRSRVMKQRTSKYETRRADIEARPTAPITAADIEAQTLRSNSVYPYFCPKKFKMREEEDEDDDVDESEDEEAPVPVPKRATRFR